MAINGLAHIVTDSPDIIRLGEHIARRPAEYLITGLVGNQKSIYIAGLRYNLLKNGVLPQLMITYSLSAAKRLYNDLAGLLGEDNVLIYPALEFDPHEEVSRDLSLLKDRLKAIEAIVQKKPTLIIAPVQAIAESLIPHSTYLAYRITIDAETRIKLDDILSKLVIMGYERTIRVESPGQFSIRGGIVDVFPVSEAKGIRIELFDDEVDSIRIFDPQTQRSESRIDTAAIGPAREFFFLPDTVDRAVNAIDKSMREQIKHLTALGESQAAKSLEVRVNRHLESLLEGIPFAGMDQYKPYYFSNLNTLIDYLDRAPIMVDEPARVREHCLALGMDYIERYTANLEKGRVLPEENKLLFDWTDIYESIKSKGVIHFSGLDQRIAGMQPIGVISIDTKAPENFQGSIEKLIEKLHTWQKKKFQVCLVLSTPEKGREVADKLMREGFSVKYTSDLNGELRVNPLVITSGSLTTGCEYSNERLVILTDTEIFGQPTRKRTVPKSAVQSKDMIGIKSYEDLKPGDYVVHVNHGIGIYLGMETLTIGNVHKDYLLVKYADEDKLYVPTDQISMLQKYIGFEESPPKLYRLGGNEWIRVKKKVKESVQEIAEGLIQLYAARENSSGYAFSPDTVWQQQFESSFPYEETPDQIRAINEVKADMERSRPMDRLLCGDVGFGKTEVAIRASFKAVMDGKQVAVLVPTTILAQQHARTFTERFQSYPVKIRVLSRFQSPGEINAVIKDLKRGTVDIVIGTHRLLSKDVVFKDLGLVIVDEEQRFGVVQKERLKELRKEVDVLTLTATPIPRTMHMSMVGVRDISVIETPPEDRFPIRTYVVEYEENMVKEAIQRELSREGQVYFVYNRVQHIEAMYRHLQQLVPEARIAIAHGQMPEDHLEQVMLDFLQGEYDILLCTTIIETGMDIANVNTLMVYDADRLGLAQLYQLRGRVGRSNRIAYSYFFYRRDKVLTEEAEKRLKAIKDFTDLGSGFKIAMRDLEIRGAGNILGPEQHGFIASVGFELYYRLLQEAIQEKRGMTTIKPPDPVFDLQVDAYIPDFYIVDSQQKVEMYKKILAVADPDDAQSLYEELTDRFGDPPLALRNLLTIARIKILAEKYFISQINQEKDGVFLKFHSGIVVPQNLAYGLMRKYRGHLLVSTSRNAGVKLRVKGFTDEQLLSFIEEVMSEMGNYWTE